MPAARPRVAPLLALALLAASCTIERAGDNAEPAPVTATTAPAESTTTTTEPPPVPLVDLRLDVEAVVTGLTAPIAMTGRPGESDLFVAEREGRVRRVAVTTNSRGTVRYRLESRPEVDISDDVSVDGERGLLGFEFSSDGRVLYLSYTDTGGSTRVDAVPLDGDRFSVDDRRNLFTLDQPFANHNGGDIHLGPDGFLYLGLGDGGGEGDPSANGQDPSTLLATIIRIDPDSDETPYAIPAGNPFVEGGGRAEVWLYGVRNPWRFSFDRMTGDLWIGDVGAGDVEEIDRLPAGGGGGRGANLGWPIMEGDRPYGTASADETVPTSPELVAPVHTYDHLDGGCSVTGGYVYRGKTIPELDGVYLFGDYCESAIRGLRVDDTGALVEEAVIGPTLESGSLVSFGEDADGELYVMSLGGETLWRIVRADPPPAEGTDKA